MAKREQQGARFPQNPVQAPPEKPKDAVKEMFDLLDKWGTGNIQTRELRQAMLALNEEPREEELFALVASADTNSSGGIEIGEFRELMEHEMTEQELDRVFRAFKVFDKDGTGFLVARELRRALTELADTLTNSEARSPPRGPRGLRRRQVDNLLQSVGVASDDGQVDYRRALSWLRAPPLTRGRMLVRSIASGSATLVKPVPKRPPAPPPADGEGEAAAPAEGPAAAAAAAAPPK